MITDTELIMLVVFVGMGIYISYLRNELTKYKMFAIMATSLLRDIATKEVEVDLIDEGIRVRKYGTH